MAEKTTPTLEKLDAEAAIELPDREMLALVVVVIRNVANGNRLSVNVSNNNIAVQVCTLVQAISALSLQRLTCQIQQK
jgi:hypothetical protein